MNISHMLTHHFININFNIILSPNPTYHKWPLLLSTKIVYASHLIFKDVYIIYQSKTSIKLIIIVLKIHILLPSDFHQESFTYTWRYKIIKGQPPTCERKNRGVVLQEVGWSTPRPGHSTHGETARYPKYRRMSVSHSWSLRKRRWRKISFPTCVRAAVRPAHSETPYGLRYSSPEQNFKLN
jgi:hypothetical protein